jgi:hypothetical protein
VWLTLASAPPAAGPVLWPPDPPGKMSWVTPLLADTAALVAGAGPWFAPLLAAGAAGGGMLAAGAWLADPGWPAGAG